MGEMYSEFTKMSGALTNVLVNYDSNDLDALESINEIQLKSAKKLIELENQQVDGYIAAIPKNSPNHQFQKIIKQINLITLAEMDVSYAWDYDLEYRQDVGRKMRYQAEPVPGLIQSGRINTKNQVRELNAIPLKNASSQEKVFIEKAIEITALFDQAFDVEDKILKNLNSLSLIHI